MLWDTFVEQEHQIVISNLQEDNQELVNTSPFEVPGEKTVESVPSSGLIDEKTLESTLPSELTDDRTREDAISSKNEHEEMLGNVLPFESPSEEMLGNAVPSEAPSEEMLGTTSSPEALSETNSQDIDNDSEENVSSHIIDGTVKANVTVADQQKTLRNLRNDARTSLNEQGINTVYLSFGFLQWTEAKSSSQVLSSSLILVPASLQWESITAPFTLQLHDDEIVINPTLAYKLENDFGITLPTFDNDSTPNKIFSDIQELVASQGWKIEPAVSLGLLSFLKINMYNDLEEHRSVIKEHPVIRCLSGDSSALELPALPDESYDHDKNTLPEDSYQIVDADSSQMDAIEYAKRGASFVLQGPPGTGKSQTITNIIAESLAAGKKILFVSEKMAALDVVHRRLKEHDLDDFTLVLHSSKANKKDVLSQLEHSLDLSSKHIKLSEAAQRELDQLMVDRTQLNEYVTELHQKIQPLISLIYDDYGVIADNADVEDVIFPIPDVRSMTPETLRATITLVTRYAALISEMKGSINNNPWKNITISVAGYEQRHDIASQSPKLLARLTTLLNLRDSLDQEYSLACSSVNDVQNIISLLEVASHSPGIPHSWITGGSFELLTARASQENQAHDSLIQTLKTLETCCANLEIYAQTPDIDAHNFSEKLNEYLQNIQSKTQKLVMQNQRFVSWQKLSDTSTLFELATSLPSHVTRLAKLREASRQYFTPQAEDIDVHAMQNRFTSSYDAKFLESRTFYCDDRKKLSTVLAIGSHALDSDAATIEALKRVNTLASLRTWASLSAELTELCSIEAHISSICEAEIYQIPNNEIYLRFKSSSASLMKVFFMHSIARIRLLSPPCSKSALPSHLATRCSTSCVS